MFSIYRNQNALSPLSEAWERANTSLKEAIVLASRRIDQHLHNAPLEQGESRDEHTRILFDAPLGVIFEVDEAKKLVRILRAWIYRAGPQRDVEWD
jgi:hypothetical protein